MPVRSKSELHPFADLVGSTKEIEMRRSDSCGVFAAIAVAAACSTATEARAGPVAFATANHGSVGRREEEGSAEEGKAK